MTSKLSIGVRRIRLESLFAATFAAGVMAAAASSATGPASRPSAPADAPATGPATAPAAGGFPDDAGLARRLILRMESANPEARRRAGLALRNLAGSGLEPIEQALKDGGLGPEGTAALRSAAPLVRARARADRRRRAVYDWFGRTVLDAYAAGEWADPKWTPLVERAVRQYADRMAATNSADHAAFVDAFRQPLDAGCRDPFVELMMLREQYHVGPGAADFPALNPRSHRAAERVVAAASYPPALKVWAVVVLVNESGLGDGRLEDAALAALPAVVKDPAVPSETLLDLVTILQEKNGRLAGAAEKRFEQLSAAYAGRPAGDAGPLVFRGRYMVQSAWAARGNGAAGTVTPDGWKAFGERLADADAALRKAYEIDPADAAAATEMLSVCVGRGAGREEMEIWFDRAMAADPDNREACRRMLYYLYPRWHGSHEEMVRFGRECLAGGNWRGQIPFTLVDAHFAVADESDDRKQYLSRPDVWRDLEEVYEQYLQFDPGAAWARSQYAKVAADCEKWAVAKREMDLLGDRPDPRVFGSMASYNYLRRKAARLAGDPAPTTQPVAPGKSDD